MGPRAILPNHGAEEIIARGGYGPGLIEATSSYVAGLISGQLSPDLVTAIEGPVRAGDLQFFAAYQEVHRHNLAKVANLRAAEGA